MVSVIVACYNQGRFLADTIRSLINQTYPDIQIIVVNDGSTDDTPEVAASFGDRVTLINQQNAGLAAARNRALDEARGEYVQILDSDDKLQSKKLEVQAGYLDFHPEVDVVYSEAMYFPDGEPDNLVFGLSGQTCRWIAVFDDNSDDIVDRIIEKNFAPVNAPLVRRSVLERVGRFDERLKGVEDWDLWLRLAQAGARFQYLDVPDCLALIRMHQTSMTMNWERMLQSTVELRIKHAARLSNSRHKLMNFAAAAGELYPLGLRRSLLPLLRIALVSRCFGVWVRFALDTMDPGGNLRSRLKSASCRRRQS